MDGKAVPRAFGSGRSGDTKAAKFMPSEGRVMNVTRLVNFRSVTRMCPSLAAASKRPSASKSMSHSSPMPDISGVPTARRLGIAMDLRAGGENVAVGVHRDRPVTAGQSQRLQQFHRHRVVLANDRSRLAGVGAQRVQSPSRPTFKSTISPCSLWNR